MSGIDKRENIEKGETFEMKKAIALIIAVCMMLLLTACGGGKAKDVDIDALAQELAGSGAFTMDISQYAMNADLAGPTYGFDAADVEHSVFYFISGTGEEIFLAKASSEDAAAKLEGLCADRVAGQKASLENYVPEAIPRLDSAVTVRQGLYVIFVVADDSAAAKTIVDKYVK